MAVRTSLLQGDELHLLPDRCNQRLHHAGPHRRQSIGARQEMAIIAQWSIGAGREIVRSVLMSQLGRMGYGRVIAHWSIGAGQEIAIIAHWSIGAGAGGGGHCVLVNTVEQDGRWWGHCLLVS